MRLPSINRPRFSTFPRSLRSLLSGLGRPALSLRRGSPNVICFRPVFLYILAKIYSCENPTPRRSSTGRAPGREGGCHRLRSQDSTFRGSLAPDAMADRERPAAYGAFSATCPIGALARIDWLVCGAELKRRLSEDSDECHRSAVPSQPRAG